MCVQFVPKVCHLVIKLELRTSYSKTFESFVIIKGAMKISGNGRFDQLSI